MLPEAEGYDNFDLMGGVWLASDDARDTNMDGTVDMQDYEMLHERTQVTRSFDPSEIDALFEAQPAEGGELAAVRQQIQDETGIIFTDPQFRSFINDFGTSLRAVPEGQQRGLIQVSFKSTKDNWFTQLDGQELEVLMAALARTGISAQAPEQSSSDAIFGAAGQFAMLAASFIAGG